MTAFADIAHVLAFALCAFIAIAGALGMTTTMSMFRSGVFLMASFLGVAGLFILLAADLMGLLQIMMYVGGMLVMILFMVLFMQDPGGAMMAAMPDMMTPVERFFSGGLQQGPGQDQEDHAQHEGMQHDDMRMNNMDMDDMIMVTPVRSVAAWLAAAIGIVLGALLLLRPSWPVVARHPDSRSAEAVGMLLMGKYMVAFEGAGFLILLGIIGAVLAAHVERHAERSGRETRVGKTGAPPQIEPDPVAPPSSQGEGEGRHAGEHAPPHSRRGPM